MILRSLIVILGLSIPLSLSYYASAFAQTAPELLITWQAANFTPPTYQGKVLPTRKTQITAAVELIDNGKLIVLNTKEIRWFLSNNLIKTGFGLKNIVFSIPAIAGADQLLKVSVISYRGRNLEKSVIVPVSNPETVIDIPYPGKIIAVGINTFQALPYFFNVANLKNLSFVWSANSQKTQGEVENPEILELDIPAGVRRGELNLSLDVTSKLDPLEIAHELIKLTIK